MIFVQRHTKKRPNQAHDKNEHMGLNDFTYLLDIFYIFKSTKYVPIYLFSRFGKMLYSLQKKILGMAEINGGQNSFKSEA